MSVGIFVTQLLFSSKILQEGLPEKNILWDIVYQKQIVQVLYTWMPIFFRYKGKEACKYLLIFPILDIFST